MKLSQTHVLARTTARTCGDGCSYLQGRLHVLAGTVKRTCGKRGSALQGRMQCTAEAIAVHCGRGCSALRLRWGKTGSPDKSGGEGKNGLSRLLFKRFLPDASGPYVASAPCSSYAQDMLLMLVPVGTPGSYISLLLGRAASVSTSDILLSLSLGAHLIVILSRRLLSGPGTEGYSSALDNGIYIVSTKLIAHRDTCLCGL